MNTVNDITYLEKNSISTFLVAYDVLQFYQRVPCKCK